jgi:hypothetical protein
MIFFSYITDFSYFPLKIVFRKLLDKVKTGKKITNLKGGVDGLNYFSLISVILFSNQDHPCNINVIYFKKFVCISA